MNNANIFSLEGKVAWVTGASYGIGFAIASALHKAGASLTRGWRRTRRRGFPCAAMSAT